MPKAELHVHLEGTIRPQTYRRIAARNGFAAPADLGSVFSCADFPSFLAAFVNVVRVLREPQDFGEIALEYLESSVRQGVRHVEFLFSPATIRYFNPGADLIAIVAAIHDAAAHARQTFGVSALIILDMVRNLGGEIALADVDLAQRCRGYGVVGVGLGGDELRFPARDFQPSFAKAKQLGLHRTAHAGEVAGSDSVRDAIEILEAERIGHAVAAKDAPEVLASIKARGVGIDACLSSNRLTGACAPGPHPLTTFLEQSIAVTLSSDDPSFFATSLLAEYEAAAELGLERDALATLARNSLTMSFAPDEAKRSWSAELDRYLDGRGQTQRPALPYRPA